MLTTDFVAGSPNWLDVASTDTSASADFYGSVFGWTFQSAGPDTGGYGFLQKDGKTVAALGPIVDEGAVPAWTVYFQTPDASATAKAVEQGGGTVRVEPFDVMEAGRMACFTDPGGVEFSVFQPAAVKGLERTREDAALGWLELHATDPAAALTFYQSVFSWQTGDIKLDGAPYTLVSPAEGDKPDASFGGLTFGGVTTAPEGAPARWLPYFDVADAGLVVSAVQGNGGSVLMPVHDIPGVGRIAWLADPFGAAFGILEPAVVPA